MIAGELLEPLVGHNSLDIRHHQSLNPTGVQSSQFLAQHSPQTNQGIFRQQADHWQNQLAPIGLGGFCLCWHRGLLGLEPNLAKGHRAMVALKH